jgi:hypothetical protein
MARLHYYYHRLLCHSLVRSVILLSIVAASLFSFTEVDAQRAYTKISFYPADHEFIQYTGRIDFTNPKLPRFWQPGVYITTKFAGSFCQIILNDEILWGNNHNYLELVVDGKASRIRTKAATDTIRIIVEPKWKEHTVSIYKNTEANIGYLEFVGIRCQQLLKPKSKPQRKIEFIGNSITCGTGSDQSAIPCGKGAWQDQHNAYLSYGSIAARQLNAQFHLSAVSGIGLMHSCCDMNIIMPQVFDKVSMRDDTIAWDFKRYQPDVVTICLGQNDGVQDSAAYCNNYIAFLKQLREYYPKATFICLSSPMADAHLFAFMKKMLTAVVKERNSTGDKKVHSFFFSKQYSGGCDWHPSVAEHKMIADELVPFMKRVAGW